MDRPPTVRPCALVALALAVLCAGFAAPAGAQVADLRVLGSCPALNLPFSGANPPPACWRPYADSSPFNRRIPEGARSHPNSRAIVERLVGFGRPEHLTAGDADTVDDYGHPTYWSRETDPLFTLHCTEPWGRCSIEGMQIRIPDAARPAAGGDAHLTVVDAVGGWEYDLWAVQNKPRGGGRLDFGWGGRTRIDGDGLASDATAARFGNLAGIIRAPELETGRIDHALFMVALCDSGTWMYPARKAGRPCSAIGRSMENAPPMGTRFQLMMSDAEIERLNVPEYRKAVLRAAARYGMFLGDTGTGSWGFQLESGSTYTSFGEPDAVAAAARRVGATPYGSRYVVDVRTGVDWASRLRVVDPCATQGTCPADEPARAPTPPIPATPAPTRTPSAPGTPAPAPDAGGTPNDPAAPDESAPAPESPGRPDAGTVTRPAARASAVRVDVTRRRNDVVARGTARGRTSGRVEVTAYLATSAARRYRKVATRISTLRGGRFTTRVASYRRGSWRVLARIRGLGRGQRDVGLSEAARGRRGVTRFQGALGSPVTPGPLPSGGFIRAGMRGRAVRFVQIALRSAGIRVPMHGRFDATTDRAVRRFQRRRLLLVDGIVGRQTLAALRAYRQVPR